MAIKSILDKSWCMHDFVQPIHMLPEVKCNSYIIKYLKFTTGNYKYSRKKAHWPSPKILHYLTLHLTVGHKFSKLQILLYTFNMVDFTSPICSAHQMILNKEMRPMY